EYTPRTKFVELVMNGAYHGLYQLTEQLKIDENRVDVGDDGFLLEIDGRAGEDPDDVYFRDNRLNRNIVIKDPDVAYGSDDFEYVKAYIASVSSALYTLGSDNGSQAYQDLIDVPSFVDWYLVNELTRNADACTFFSSCYMNLKRGEKLKMGPLWDFDLAVGNYVFAGGEGYNSPTGFSLRYVSWYTNLYKSPQFVSELKSRFDALYDSREDLYDNLRSQRDYIREAYIENELKWRRLNVGTNRDVISQNFDTRVEGIVDWLETRFNWMKGEFDQL
ncbi:MAG: CotH kinase family protein, partial [Muribaculaceae bacterium]|nr:CotH kinase family protein [Muribaculaceae bacterium]